MDGINFDPSLLNPDQAFANEKRDGEEEFNTLLGDKQKPAENDKADDPAITAHLQRYADEIASGREAPSDLVEALKAAGIADPESEIEARGITGNQVADATLAAHLERAEAYKTAGQEVPPDLMAAIAEREAAAGPEGADPAGDTTGEPNGNDAAGAPLPAAMALNIVQLIKAAAQGDAEAIANLNSLAAASGLDIDPASPPTPGFIASLLGMSAGASADKTAVEAALLKIDPELDLAAFWSAPMSQSIATLEAIANANTLSQPGGEDPAKAGLAYDKNEAAEIVEIYQKILGSDAEVPTDDIERLNELGFPFQGTEGQPSFLEKPKVSTIASLAGIENFKDISEEALRTELSNRGINLPDDFFKSGFTADKLELLQKIATSNTLVHEGTDTPETFEVAEGELPASVDKAEIDSFKEAAAGILENLGRGDDKVSITWDNETQSLVLQIGSIKINPGLEVDGSKELDIAEQMAYLEGQLNDLEAISETDTGKKLLNSILDKNVVVNIVAPESGNGVTRFTEDKSEIIVELSGEDGVSGAVVDPWQSPTNSPSDVSLFHELVHAEKRQADPSLADKPAEEVTINGITIKREEVETVGLGEHANDEITENAYREDRGLTRRTFYSSPDEIGANGTWG